jgi:type IV pilus assembly protein PilX
VSGTIIQNKMAGNQYDRELAFQASEAALRHAEVTIEAAATIANPVPDGIEDCSTHAGQIAPVNPCVANPFADAEAAAFVTTLAKDDFDAGAIAASQPQYVVQYMGRFITPLQSTRQVSDPSPYGSGGVRTLADYYRITARSGNPSTVGERAVVTLQSVFQTGAED